MKQVNDHHATIQPEGHGSVFRVEGQVLATIAHLLGGHVLELGACKGISSRFILDGLSPNALLMSVDREHQWSGPDYLDPEAARHHRVTDDTRTFQSNVKFKWAFIDGDHSLAGVAADVDTAERHGCQYLVFHDTNPVLKSVIQGGRPADGAHWVANGLSTHIWDCIELNTPAGMCIAKRRSAR